MNLPNLNPLSTDQSTYITFTKSLMDFDHAENANQPCYFSKMVALNLPAWKNPNFFIDLSDMEIGISNKPNTVFPKVIQYYMENIIRQDVTDLNDNPIENITEISFWKMLSKLGMSKQQINDSIVFINDIVTSNFVTVKNNNGWGTIVCEIPNKCKLLVPAMKTISDFPNIVTNVYTDICLHDNETERNFTFDAEQKEIIDFENISYDEVEQTTFDFNTLLLFYTDPNGNIKLHGINFIQPFEFGASEWILPKFTHKTNIIQTIGYQFKFNLKTCNNDATQQVIYDIQEHTFWNVFGETLGKFNEFLETQKKSIV